MVTKTKHHSLWYSQWINPQAQLKLTNPKMAHQDKAFPLQASSLQCWKSQVIQFTEVCLLSKDLDVLHKL